MHLTYTQETRPTKEQQQRIDNIFTPDYIIESSKSISIEKQQDSVIAVRDIQIKELEAKIEALKQEHLNTLVEIARENNNVREASNESDELADEQLRKERLRWKGLHLYGGLEVPKFKVENTSINLELMYELNKVHFGFLGEVGPGRVEESKYGFVINAKLRYKFF